MKTQSKRSEELQFISSDVFLKDALPPIPPAVYWKCDKHDFAITEGSINIISSRSTSCSVQLSLRIATQIACTKQPIMPTRGVNPYSGINESAEYDQMLVQESKPMSVLYINTMLSEPQLERESIDALPGLLEWIWVKRQQGVAYPYQHMNLHYLNAQAGTLMKEDHKNRLIAFVRDHRVKVIVLNSFEFACRTQREKDDMMYVLKSLRDLYGVSIVVFTQETKQKLLTSTRGPLPMLALLAEFVKDLKEIDPDMKPRKIEYAAPVILEEKPVAVYVEAEVVNSSLASVTEHQLLSGMDDLDVAALHDRLSASGRGFTLHLNHDDTTMHKGMLQTASPSALRESDKR